MSSGHEFKTKSQLATAVDLWISDESSATTTYGDINTRDVRAITDFFRLFALQSEFNSDISNWVVSNGIYFQNMFRNAYLFTN